MVACIAHHNLKPILKRKVRENEEEIMKKYNVYASSMLLWAEISNLGGGFLVFTSVLPRYPQN